MQGPKYIHAAKEHDFTSVIKKEARGLLAYKLNTVYSCDRKIDYYFGVTPSYNFIPLFSTVLIGSNKKHFKMINYLCIKLLLI